METQICVTGSLNVTRLFFFFFSWNPRRLAAKRRAAAVELTGQGLADWESQLLTARHRSHGRKQNDVLTLKRATEYYMSKMMPRQHLIWLIICSQPSIESAKVLPAWAETGTDRQKTVCSASANINTSAHSQPFSEQVCALNICPSLPCFIQQCERYWLRSEACLHKLQRL